MGRSTIKFKGRNEAALSHHRLLELVFYDPETGIFSKRNARRGVRDGDHLGHVEKNGYRRICLDGRRYLAHRLAWFYVYGTWPDKDIDHRDLNKDNNSIKNLRVATPSQNKGNVGSGRGSRSGLKGAHWNASRGHWQSYIKVAGRSIRLGRFETAEEAHSAYCVAAREHFGEFWRAE